jgi:hypothetical protein
LLRRYGKDGTEIDDTTANCLGGASCPGFDGWKSLTSSTDLIASNFVLSGVTIDGGKITKINFNGVALGLTEMPDFAGCSEMLELSLTNTQITAFPYLGYMPQLVFMQASSNPWDSPLTDLSNMGNLEHFIVGFPLGFGSGKGLTGSIPDLSGLAALKVFELIGHTQLTGTLPSFANSPDLERLYVTMCSLTGAIPSFASNTKATHFYLSGPPGTPAFNPPGQVWLQDRANYPPSVDLTQCGINNAELCINPGIWLNN